MENDNIAMLTIFVLFGFCIGAITGMQFDNSNDNGIADEQHVYTYQYNTHGICIGDHVKTIPEYDGFFDGYVIDIFYSDYNSPVFWIEDGAGNREILNVFWVEKVNMHYPITSRYVVDEDGIKECMWWYKL